MLSGLLNVRTHLKVDAPAAMLRLCFIAAAALYNDTEASFCGINNRRLLLLLASIDVSGQRKAARPQKNSAMVARYSYKHPRTRGQR